MVSQPYSASFLEEHLIRGNSAIMKCHLPAFVGDFVSVVAWTDGHSTITYNDDNRFNYGKHTHFRAFPLRRRVGASQVWWDMARECSGGRDRSNANSFSVTISVVAQAYDANFMQQEYVIRGNSALMKCHLPAFVGDFVSVVSWFYGDEEILLRDFGAGVGVGAGKWPGERGQKGESENKSDIA